MPKVKINRERCKGCQLCLIYCPKGLIEKDKNLNKKGIQPLVFRNGAAADGRDVGSLGKTPPLNVSGGPIPMDNAPPSSESGGHTPVGKTPPLEVSGGSIPVDKCNGCKFCAIICPDGAVEIYK